MKLSKVEFIVKNNSLEKSFVFLKSVPYVILGTTNLIYNLNNINIENKN